jgi:hypothetical protein
MWRIDGTVLLGWKLDAREEIFWWIIIKPLAWPTSDPVYVVVRARQAFYPRR